MGIVLRTDGTIDNEPIDIEVAKGVSVKVRPVSTFDMILAQFRAKDHLDKLKGCCETASYAGFDRFDLDLNDALISDGVFQQKVIEHLAESNIVAWDGVKDYSGAPVDVSVPGAKVEVMKVFPLGALFYAQLSQAMYARLGSGNPDGGISAE